MGVATAPPAMAGIANMFDRRVDMGGGGRATELTRPTRLTFRYRGAGGRLSFTGKVGLVAPEELARVLRTRKALHQSDGGSSKIFIS